MHETQALTYIAMILAAAFAGGALLQRVKQPVLVGYILVGMLLGPSGIGLVENNAGISLIAEMGVLLLLFIVGMEIDLQRFGKIAKLSVTTCVAQIGLGLLTMGILALLFGWSLNRAILLGFCVALSSTVVALKTVEEHKLANTTAGDASVGILVAQDIAVIPMILIMGMLGSLGHDGHGGDSLMGGLFKLVFAIALLGSLMWVFTKKPTFLIKTGEKLASIKRRMMSEQIALTALSGCFIAASIAGLMGLSAAYGAFIAGLMIGQTKAKHALHKEIQPIYDILIMVFFISIGVLIDLNFIMSNLASIIAALIVTMALKTVVNYQLLIRQGMGRSDALTTSAVLSQLGEFAFILAAMGLASGAIMQDGYKFVVALISLSLLFTPLWMVAVKRLAPPVVVAATRATKKARHKRRAKRAVKKAVTARKAREA